MSKKEFNNNCFSPNWLEVDLRDAAKSSEDTLNKEVRLESDQHKDLKTL